jgi:protein-tyrosine phosphatase
MSNSDKEFHVLFLCSGNTCRSPMAVAALVDELPAELHDRVRIGSAGTGAAGGAPMSAGARGALERAGLAVPPHASRRLTTAMLRAADLVLAMEPAHVDAALALEPSAAGRVHLLADFATGAERAGDGVDDPYGGSDEVYDACLARIRRHTHRVARHLHTQLAAAGRGGPSDGQSDVGSG